jgi:hypothetical protein
MKGQNFISVIDNVMTEELCCKLIEGFHLVHDNEGSWNRQDADNSPKINKEDIAVRSADLLVDNLYSSVHDSLTKTIKDYLLNYVKEFEVGMFANTPINEYPINQTGIKIQMTKPSQGYHVWHCENSSQIVKGRFLTWILYLNDVDEGGETEFIHLSERVKPKTGRLVIFPAGWTHTHRGNPPLSNIKYIATGWLEYTE